MESRSIHSPYLALGDGVRPVECECGATEVSVVRFITLGYEFSG